MSEGYSTFIAILGFSAVTRRLNDGESTASLSIKHKKMVVKWKAERGVRGRGGAAKT